MVEETREKGTGKQNFPPETCNHKITLGGSVEVGSGVEDNPVTALAQPPALHLSGPHCKGFTVRTACLPSGLPQRDALLIA